ncbi:Lysophospholipase, alpha-beta hydrolase superfamily [Chitinophaga sp. YR627]|uniref:alpha/beta hydrolase n=1 Tax=Chitinophaga sp. YR627 TaxID=1881041 RepID=UPI0008ECF228|nr:alpha/beta hydrolase [Chitinophaga sp. YR627]SFM87825.1 Lysophospholipase, alpha-beta hydrolase superfamily [Chitinophaga sp. YR627]
MEKTSTKTVVFITGAFVHHSCWDDWKSHFESKGYRAIVPPWPYKNTSAEALRNSHPNRDIAAMRLAALTAHYDHIIRALPEKPILIGHSIGGLITQLLLQRGLGESGVAIHSVPPQGIMTFKFSFLKAGWGPLGFFTPASKSFLMSFDQWKYAFTNGMDCDAQKEAYYNYAIPESKLIVRDTITAAAKVNFQHPHAPLLLTAGSEDHTIPASLNYANYKKYSNSNSVTDYKEFKGRNHFVLGQPTWKEDADYILEWLNKHS